ncbi:hypothetical protein AB0F17_58680 [Nonomuraea sp. NPDC026600]|uniref:hypothetical protein n=1 Tax=Nonomuraea sp. NPDC026600 TaxID=3155363 RepID=UPI0033E2073E
MTPTPEPSPAPTVTVTVPVPIATPQVTVTVQQQPPDQPHLIEQIDGWGSMLAALAAAVGLGIALWQAKKARKEADGQLGAEREIADARLQAQFNEQRERDWRDFLIEQLLRVGDLYAEKAWASRASRPDLEQKAIRKLAIHLPAVPGKYASLLKWDSQVAFYEEAKEEALRRMAHGQGRLEDHRIHLHEYLIAEELAENIEELLQPRNSEVDTGPVDNS